VDEAMNAFGETAKLAIYYYMERSHDLKYNDIVERPQEFMEALREMFGYGADLIEDMLVEKLAAEFGIELKEVKFDKAVEEVRKKVGEG
jgi:hypothetical protein